jgi:hypothetical protein
MQIAGRQASLVPVDPDQGFPSRRRETAASKGRHPFERFELFRRYDRKLCSEDLQLCRYLATLAGLDSIAELCAKFFNLNFKVHRHLLLIVFER